MIVQDDDLEILQCLTKNGVKTFAQCVLCIVNRQNDTHPRCWTVWRGVWIRAAQDNGFRGAAIKGSRVDRAPAFLPHGLKALCISQSRSAKRAGAVVSGNIAQPLRSQAFQSHQGVDIVISHTGIAFDKNPASFAMQFVDMGARNARHAEIQQRVLQLEMAVALPIERGRLHPVGDDLVRGVIAALALIDIGGHQHRFVAQWHAEIDPGVKRCAGLHADKTAVFTHVVGPRGHEIHICRSIGVDQLFDAAGRVPVIGIEIEDEVAAGEFQPFVHGRIDAPVGFRKDIVDLVFVTRQDVQRIIRRSAIDHQVFGIAIALTEN